LQTLVKRNSSVMGWFHEGTRLKIRKQIGGIIRAGGRPDKVAKELCREVSSAPPSP
jgi:hypothetical protein